MGGVWNDVKERSKLSKQEGTPTGLTKVRTRQTELNFSQPLDRNYVTVSVKRTFRDGKLPREEGGDSETADPRSSEKLNNFLFSVPTRCHFEHISDAT